MKMIMRVFFALLISTILIPEISMARHGFRGRFYYGPGWNHGYWFHGAYGGRAGWWWVVGPTWYYYPAPVYPYPVTEAQPVYFVQMNGVPPPPMAPPGDGSLPPASAPPPTPAASPQALPPPPPDSG